MAKVQKGIDVNMKKEFSRLPSCLTELNKIEKYLSAFLIDYPEYRCMLIGMSEDKEIHYQHLLDLMKAKWKKDFPDAPFFLEDTSLYLNENFFIPQNENVAVRANLRYMPFLLHSHQFIELNYVVNSNDSSMITKNGRQPLEDGDIILCPPGFVHCFDTQTAESIIIDFFIRITTFDSVFFSLLNHNNYLSAVFANALYNSGEGYIIWHCGGDSRLESIVLSAFDEWQRHEKYSERMLEIWVMQLLVLLMRYHEQEAIFSMPDIYDTDRLFQSLLNYMYTHCQTVTLTQLAHQYNYSERQVIRLLKKHSGKGFSELLLDIRMNRAIQLLKNPSISIQQIAAQLGYSSINYFRKTFIKTFTFSPEDFRNRVKEMCTMTKDRK